VSIHRARAIPGWVPEPQREGAAPCFAFDAATWMEPRLAKSRERSPSLPLGKQAPPLRRASAVWLFGRAVLILLADRNHTTGRMRTDHVLVNHAVFHHEDHLARSFDIVEWISIDSDNVRIHARGN
jgi:hypothetical protein